MNDTKRFQKIQIFQMFINSILTHPFGEHLKRIPEIVVFVNFYLQEIFLVKSTKKRDHFFLPLLQMLFFSQKKTRLLRHSSAIWK